MRKLKRTDEVGVAVAGKEEKLHKLGKNQGAIPDILKAAALVGTLAVEIEDMVCRKGLREVDAEDLGVGRK